MNNQQSSTRQYQKLFLILEELRKLDPDIPIQTAAVYLVVCMLPGITMKEIVQRLGISQASVSRNVAALSKMHRLNKPGLDLIKAEEDPVERRRKVVKLTPKGQRVAETLQRLMGEE